MAAPFAARAQHRAMPIIAWLSGSSPAPSINPNAIAFREGLAEAGFVEGRTVAFENRWADGYFDRLQILAVELADRRVDLIVAIGDPAAHAARIATSSIPIVFIGGDDPVAAGLGADMARPRGNVTGVTVLTGELNPKRLELLLELMPTARSIGLLVNPQNPAIGRVIQIMQQAAGTSGRPLRVLSASSDSEIDAAIAGLVDRKLDALVVDADQAFAIAGSRIVDLAARNGIPAVYGFRNSPESGGLISYGANLATIFRQAGVYAGKILAGKKPSDLPILRPEKFELVVNMRTAKALGLKVPPSILARADEILE